MSKPEFRKDYIKSIADAIMHAPVEKIVEFSQLFEQHPYGEELAEEVSTYLFGQFITELFGLEESVEEVEETESTSLSDVIKSQVTAKELSKMLREQIQREEMAESIRARFFDYTEQGEPQEDPTVEVTTFTFAPRGSSFKEETRLETPAATLASLIKEQVTTKNLSASIREQVEEQEVEDEEEIPEITVEEEVEDILEEIIDDIIDQDAVPTNFSLGTDTIQYYQLAFEGAFLHKAEAHDLPEGVEYKAEYTAYILSELASYAVTFKGMELTFQVSNGTVSPALA